MKRPTFMQHYWHWLHEGGDWYISRSIYYNFTSDLANKAIGNYFESYEECEAHPEVRERLAKQLAKEPELKI